MEWISVKDRLPEIPEGNFTVGVIVAQFDPYYEEINPGHGYDVFEMQYDGIHFLDMLIPSGDFIPSTMCVTHWMPLPEPPKH